MILDYKQLEIINTLDANNVQKNRLAKILAKALELKSLNKDIEDQQKLNNIKQHKRDQLIYGSVVNTVIIGAFLAVAPYLPILYWSTAFFISFVAVSNAANYHRNKGPLFSFLKARKELAHFPSTLAQNTNNQTILARDIAEDILNEEEKELLVSLLINAKFPLELKKVETSHLFDQNLKDKLLSMLDKNYPARYSRERVNTPEPSDKDRPLAQNRVNKFFSECCEYSENRPQFKEARQSIEDLNTHIKLLNFQFKENIYSENKKILTNLTEVDIPKIMKVWDDLSKLNASLAEKDSVIDCLILMHEQTSKIIEQVKNETLKESSIIKKMYSHK